MGVLSEGLESFGGQGYIEDTGLPVLMRDCQVCLPHCLSQMFGEHDVQVTPIWEGTTNILSLDVCRVLATDPKATLQVLQVCLRTAV
jgi:alkylation response protein AidB-like acyl-CoA dehydrogenase